MNPHLRVLIVEDSEDDTLLVLRALRNGHYTVEHLQVDTAALMQAALTQRAWDIVIADYNLPMFSAPEALQLLQRQNLDLPFIIVSGTIGEELAVAAMKAGANDYVLKGNLARLAPAVERELREAQERQKRLLAEQALQHATAKLQINAAELEELYNNAPCGYHSLDKDGFFIRINDTELAMLGYSRDAVIRKKTFSDLLTSESVEIFNINFPLFQKTGWVQDLEFELIRKDGTILPVSLSGTAVTDASGTYRISRWVVIDISDRKSAETQLRHADQELQVANSRLTGILEGTQDLVAALDLNFRLIVFNSAYQREFQRIFDRTVAVGMSLIDTLAHLPTDQAKAMEMWGQALRGEEFTVIEEFGDERLSRNYYEITYSTIRDANHQIIGATQISRDVTTRRRAEEELRNSEERYRLMFENNPNPMWVFDSETLAFFAVNQAAIAHYGYSIDEFLGMTILDIRPLTDVIAVQQLYSSFVPGQNYSGVWKHLKKDGTLIDVEILAHTFLFVGRQVCLVLVNDITERKQADQKILEQAALLDITLDAICVQDLDHRILFWNKGAEHLYGWEAAEVLGKNAIALLSGSNVSPSQLEEIHTLLMQSGVWKGEFQHLTQTQKTVLVDSQWTLVCDDAGNPKSILTVSTDVTEKKQLEAQFLRAQRLESLGTLASGIAHDFNNVLTPVLAAAQLLPLKLPDLDERNQQLLKLIENSAKRGADLVKQILAFARGTESNRLPLQVRHPLAEVLKVLRQTFPKNIEIHNHVPSEDVWTVSADVTQLHQVLMNLCVNARDAMPEGGILTLAVENQQFDEASTRLNLEAKVDAYVVITISDTGLGIPDELMDRIFDPFFTTKEVGKGTGLGLSTVLGIVKKHGGFIKVNSTVGQGTEFKVYLPACEAGMPAPPEEAMPPRGNQELVLIVDDEPLIQQVAQGILEAHNYRTLTANEGNQAIALYTQHADDISAVLMDIMMPSMDGVTASRVMEALNPNINIIATSGLATNYQLTQSVNPGIKAFLSKPYTAKELLDVLSTILGTEQA